LNIHSSELGENFWRICFKELGTSADSDIVVLMLKPVHKPFIFEYIEKTIGINTRAAAVFGSSVERCS
jgi:DNA-binding protein Fis